MHQVRGEYPSQRPQRVATPQLKEVPRSLLLGREPMPCSGGMHMQQEGTTQQGFRMSPHEISPRHCTEGSLCNGVTSGEARILMHHQKLSLSFWRRQTPGHVARSHKQWQQEEHSTSTFWNKGLMQDFPVVSDGKHLPYNAGNQVQSLSWKILWRREVTTPGILAENSGWAWQPGHQVASQTLTGDSLLSFHFTTTIKRKF